MAVLRIHGILVRIRIRIRICGSVPHGRIDSDPDSAPDPAIFVSGLQDGNLKIILFLLPTF
jgi:hypothetical protein